MRVRTKSSKYILLTAILLAAIILTALFAGMVTYASAAEEKKVLVVLGDSIANGSSAGSTAQERAEKGYAGLVGKEKDLVVKNISTGGWRTAHVINQLETDEEAKEAVRTADYIQIAIGGNDLQQQGQVGPAVAALLEGDESGWEQHSASIAARFAQIVELVRGLNSNAPFFVFNSYTPDYKRLGGTNIAAMLGTGGPSSITGNELYQKAQDYAIPYFNSTYEAYLEEHPGAFILVDIFDAFYENNTIFYGTGVDIIHPSALGHTMLANRLIKAIDAYEYIKLQEETTKTVAGKDAEILAKNNELTGKDSVISGLNSDIKNADKNKNLMLTLVIIESVIILLGGTGVLIIYRKKRIN